MRKLRVKGRNLRLRFARGDWNGSALSGLGRVWHKSQGFACGLSHFAPSERQNTCGVDPSVSDSYFFSNFGKRLRTYLRRRDDPAQFADHLRNNFYRLGSFRLRVEPAEREAEARTSAVVAESHRLQYVRCVDRTGGTG